MSDFTRNLEFLYTSSTFETKEAFAAAVGIGRTTMSRLMRGSRPPNARHLTKISKHSGIEAKDLFLEPAAFAKTVRGIIPSDLMLLSFRSVKVNQHRWKKTLDGYKGQYFLYYGKTTDDAK